MKKIYFALIVIFITTVVSFPSLKIALANEEGTGTSSATREAIEQTEEKLLGSEKHAELEKVEPGIDASIQRIAPLALGGVSLMVLLTALYLKSKKNKV